MAQDNRPLLQNLFTPARDSSPPRLEHRVLHSSPEHVIHPDTAPYCRPPLDSQTSFGLRHESLGENAQASPRGAPATKHPQGSSPQSSETVRDPEVRHRRNQSSVARLARLNTSAPLPQSDLSQNKIPPAPSQPPEAVSLSGPVDPAPREVVESTMDASTGTLRSFYQKNKGLCYVLLAQVFGCLMNVTTRLLEVEGNNGAGMHPFQILFVRMAITTTLSTAYMWWTQIPHFPFGLKEVRWLLAIRGIGGFFGVFGMYYSLLYLPLADATVITFIAPSLSCWACSILIKEPFTRMEQLGALVSFIGVTLIARPTTFFHAAAAAAANSRRDLPPEGVEAAAAAAAGASTGNKAGAMDYADVSPAQRLGAILVALTGVLGSAMAFTAMRWIGKRAHPLLSVNYFCAWCTIVSATAMLILPGVEFLLPANPTEWAYLIFLGLCGFAMQFLLSAGLQHEKSSRATNMVYTQMLFALIFDKLVFGTNPSLLSLLGSSLILGSAIYIAVQKESIKARAEAEKARQLAANSTGSELEMQSTRSRSLTDPQREEEVGLVSDMDAHEEEKPFSPQDQRASPRPVG